MNVFSIRIVSLISLLLALSACALPPPDLPAGKPIPPGYLYKADFLDIHSPNEEGWRMVAAADKGDGGI